MRIQGGEFTMGSEAFENAQPLHTVTVRTFEMTRHEVTYAEYAVCQAAGVCPQYTDEQIRRCKLDERVNDDEPVRCLFRADAVTFAEWAQARLPSEAEWEFAATSRGTRRPYPWGDAP